MSVIKCLGNRNFCRIVMLSISSEVIILKNISEVTRRDIQDLFVCGVEIPGSNKTQTMLWCGRLDEVDFLDRIYDLDSLPSNDRRYAIARGDIACHTSWGDWEQDWIFTDSRFNLMGCEDEDYLKFICEVFHPAVTLNSIELPATPESGYFTYVSALLKQEGYELYELKRLGGKPVIGWRVICGADKVIEAQAAALVQVFNSDYIQKQVEQMQNSIETNPTDAIGKAKELVESCCKTILDKKGVSVDSNWDVPRLTKETCSVLNLLPNNVDNSVQGAETIRRILGNLVSLPHGLAELRNPYGTGHGRSNSFVALTPKHARLAVGAATSACWFLWETYQESVGTV